MTDHEKMTDGLNVRPRNASIAQSAPGLPDDSGGAPPVDVTEEDVARVRSKLLGHEEAREKLEQEVSQEIAASERGSE